MSKQKPTDAMSEEKVTHATHENFTVEIKDLDLVKVVTETVEKYAKKEIPKLNDERLKPVLSELKQDTEKFLDKLLSYLPFTKDDLAKLKHIKEFDWQKFCNTGTDSQPGLLGDEVTHLPKAPEVVVEKEDTHEGMYVVSFSYDVVKADNWDKPTRRVGTYEGCNEYVKQNKPNPEQIDLF